MHRRTPRALALLVLLAFATASCAQTGETVRDNPKATMGGLLGAAAGGLIAAGAGGGTAAIIGGVLAGGLIGGAVGNRLDQKDKELAMQNAQRTFEHARTGEASTWHNPDTGNSGSITPTRTYQGGGQYCREYQQEIVIGGEPQQSYGTACRRPDGSWQVQD